MTKDEQARAIEIELELRRRAQATPPPAPAPAPVPAAPPAESPPPGQAPEIGIIRDIMRDPKTTGAERLGMIAPYLYYKGKDMAQTAGIRGVPVAVGDYVGRRLGGPVGGFAGRTVGGFGGSLLDQWRLMHEQKQNGIQLGQATGDALNAGLSAGGKIMGNPYVQGLSNMAAKTVETLIDSPQHRFPTKDEYLAAGGGGFAGAKAGNFVGENIPSLTQEEMTRLERFNEQKRQSFNDVRNWGVKTTPREIGMGKDASGVMTAFSGPVEMKRDAQLNNAMIWNEKTREQFGMAPGTEPIRARQRTPSGDIIPSEWDEIHAKADIPYEKIQKISEDAQKTLAQYTNIPAGHLTPHVQLQINMAAPAAQKALIEAAADVNKLKGARANARAAWESKQSDPQGWYAKYTAAKQEMDQLETNIDNAAKSVGNPELSKELVAARKLHAQLFAAESATVGGHMDPTILNALKEKDGVLYDQGSNLDKMANFARDHERQAGSGSNLQPSGPGNMHMQFAGTALAGDNPRGPTWAFLDAFGPKYTRAMQLSQGMQNYYAAPRIPAPGQIAETLARYAPQAASRDYGR